MAHAVMNAAVLCRLSFTIPPGSQIVRPLAMALLSRSLLPGREVGVEDGEDGGSWSWISRCHWKVRQEGY